MNRVESDLFGYIQENYEKPNLFKYNSLTESEKGQVGTALIDKIYATIANQYNSINFETIPASHGKISSMKEFSNLSSSVGLLKKIAADSNQKINEVDVLEKALSNMQKYEDIFYNGFVKNNAQLIMTYNLLAMSLYCGTSLMISVLIDYINIANTELVDVIIRKKYSKSNSYLMINSLSTFNTMVDNGGFQEFIISTTKVKKLNESVVMTTGIVIAAILGLFKIIPLIKELIYIFYFSKMKMSEATAIQAELINANIEALKSSGNATPKMIRIQSWFADKLSMLSNTFAIKYENNEHHAKQASSAMISQNDIMLF